MVIDDVYWSGSRPNLQQDTGKALCSPHIPHEVHAPMAVEWATVSDDDVQKAESPPEVIIPPIVPIHSAGNLAKLGVIPMPITSVNLTFRRWGAGETLWLRWLRGHVV